MSIAALLATTIIASPGSGYALPLTLGQAEATTAPVDQEVAPAGQDPLGWGGADWSIQGGFAYQFNASLNDTQSGRFSHGRAHLHARGRIPLSKDVDLLLGGRYQRDNYSFDNLLAPWDNVNTIRADAALEWRADDHWTLFGGGMVQWAAQQGASLGDGFEGGGAIGAVYGFSSDLALGGGVGVQTRVEDDVLVYPIIVVDWKIADRWTLSTRLTSGWANQTGAELVYAIDDNVDVGVTAVFDYQRFRLSDDGPLAARGGAGTVEALPVTLFLSFDVGQRASITGFVGVMAYGRLKTTDTNQTDIWASDQDVAPVLGIQGTINF